MSTPDPNFGIVSLPGVVAVAPNRKIPPKPPGIIGESFSYDSYLMDNPSIPRLYIRLERDGVEEDLVIAPETVDWAVSVEASDMLKFTVPDPDYFLINHPMLQDPFKTTVKFRFGYDDNMSDTGELIFFRQRPEFPQSGVVKTTIVAYDYSVFFTFATTGKRLEGMSIIGTKDLVRGIVADVNEEFGIKLDVSFDDVEYENKVYGFSVPHATPMEHLASLRAVAKVKGGGDETLAEIYVQGKTLHFHPPRRRLVPIAAFAYFDEHPGARLLEFSPDVDIEYRAKLNQAALGVNADVGKPEVSESAGDKNEHRNTTTRTGISGVTGIVTKGVVGKGDTPSRAEVKTKNVKHKVSASEVGNLMGIVEQYPGVNFQEFLDVNNLDEDNYELRPDEVLDIPVPDPGDNVETPESTAQAVGDLLDAESRASECSATVLGNPRLVAGFPVDIFNVGNAWSGRWYLREVTHSYGSGGYMCQLRGTREPIARNKAAAGVNTNTTLKVPEDAKKQEAKSVAAVSIGGERGTLNKNAVMPKKVQ